MNELDISFFSETRDYVIQSTKELKDDDRKQLEDLCETLIQFFSNLPPGHREAHSLFLILIGMNARANVHILKYQQPELKITESPAAYFIKGIQDFFNYLPGVGITLSDYLNNALDTQTALVVETDQEAPV